MLITESKLRAVIRRIIKESSQETLGVNTNSVDKIKEIIKNWIHNEVSGSTISDIAWCLEDERFLWGTDETVDSLLFQIIEIYSELKSNGEPKDEDFGYDFNYWCDDIMSLLKSYGNLVQDNRDHPLPVGVKQPDFGSKIEWTPRTWWYLSFSEMPESAITDVWEAIKESPYVKKALIRLNQEIGQESLKSADDGSSIEQKILDALTKDMTEEEIKDMTEEKKNKMKANIGELIKSTIESFKDELEKGTSFEKAYKDAKDYLESFYKFD